MNIDGCGIDWKALEKESKPLFSISRDFLDIHISIDEASLEKFIRNGFRVDVFNSVDEVIDRLSREISGDAYYLDRFESAVIGGMLETAKPVRSLKDVEWYKLRIGISYADILSVDTGSLFFIEDSILTNITSYPEKLYIVVSSSRLSREFIGSFDVIYALNELFGNEFLIRIVNAPSRTGDIEKKIVFGAHGPKEVDIYIFNDGFGVSDIFLSYLALKHYNGELCLRGAGHTLDHFLVRYENYIHALELEV